MRFVVMLLLVGCGHTITTSASLGSVVRKNMVLAYHTYYGEYVNVSGVVMDLGVDTNMDEVLARKIATNKPDNFYIFNHSSDPLKPFVVLADNMEDPDLTVCFFDYKHSQPVALLSRGNMVVLGGVVSKFFDYGGHIYSVLDDCSVVSKRN